MRTGGQADPHNALLHPVHLRGGVADVVALASGLWGGGVHCGLWSDVVLCHVHCGLSGDVLTGLWVTSFFRGVLRTYTFFARGQKLDTMETRR